MNNYQYDQLVFYELGRNFWVIGNQLGGTTIGANSFTSGFAVLMRFLSLDSTGQAGGPFNSWTYTQFEQNVKDLVDEYVANPSLNFGNTLAAGQGVPNSQLASTDLFASFLLRLGLEFGGNAFYQSLWKQAAALPAATTDQGAIDNLFLAACYATDADLTDLFVNTWRWPISSAAQSQVASLPSASGTPGAPKLDPGSDTGVSSSDGITQDNGSPAAPLTFDVSATAGSGEFFRVYDVTDPHQPVLLTGPVQAPDGTIAVSGHMLADGTHQIAVTTAVSANSTESALSPSTTISILTSLRVTGIAPSGNLHTSLPNNQVVVTFNHPLAGLVADRADGTGLAGNPFAVMLLPAGPDAPATVAAKGSP